MAGWHHCTVGFLVGWVLLQSLLESSSTFFPSGAELNDSCLFRGPFSCSLSLPLPSYPSHLFCYYPWFVAFYRVGGKEMIPAQPHLQQKGLEEEEEPGLALGVLAQPKSPSFWPERFFSQSDLHSQYPQGCLRRGVRASGPSQERTGESGAFGLWPHPRGSSRISS